MKELLIAAHAWCTEKLTGREPLSEADERLLELFVPLLRITLSKDARAKLCSLYAAYEKEKDAIPFG